MKKDRSNWTVRKVTFAEAEELDNQYYSSLSAVERLELIMDLRSRVKTNIKTIKPIVTKRYILE